VSEDYAASVIVKRGVAVLTQIPLKFL